MVTNVQLLNGIVLVDKPYGWTSFDVVNYIRKIIAVAENKKTRYVKVGHTGTLDPMATGLLILVLGSATKKSDQFMKQDKVYEAEITLGGTSSTDDALGEITPVAALGKPTEAEVINALQAMKGEISQVPPQFSAIKVGGRRAYASARAGDTVELAARSVTIYDIDAIRYAYPVIAATFAVSSGTYIRSIARDLGEQVACGGYLSGLRRISVGEWQVAGAMPVEGCTYDQLKESLLEV